MVGIVATPFMVRHLGVVDFGRFITVTSLMFIVSDLTEVGLTSIGVRMYLAGALPNTPENLVRWIRQPQEIRRPNVMPDMGVTEGDGRDIAAYLYTLQ